MRHFSWKWLRVSGDEPPRAGRESHLEERLAIRVRQTGLERTGSDWLALYLHDVEEGLHQDRIETELRPEKDLPVLGQDASIMANGERRSGIEPHESSSWTERAEETAHDDVRVEDDPQRVRLLWLLRTARISALTSAGGRPFRNACADRSCIVVTAWTPRASRTAPSVCSRSAPSTLDKTAIGRPFEVTTSSFSSARSCQTRPGWPLRSRTVTNSMAPPSPNSVYDRHASAANLHRPPLRASAFDVRARRVRPYSRDTSTTNRDRKSTRLKSRATMPGAKWPRSPFRDGRPTISTRTPSCRTNRRISPTTSSDSRETTIAPSVIASWMISVNFRCSIAERFSGRSRRRRT